MFNETEKSDLNTKAERVYPSWKSTIYALVNSFESTRNGKGVSVKEIEQRLAMLDLVKKSIKKFHPSQIIEMLAQKGGPELPPNRFNELLEQFQRICIAENQFYTIYDVKLGWHSIIDSKIESALGIKADQFSLQAMAGMDDKNPLYHPEDVNHMNRWACISYMLISFPGFEWNTLSDYYYVSHRVGTQSSMDESIRNRGYVMLEKRCYPLFGFDNSSQLKLAYHFDQWSVLDASGFDYVKPHWVTTSNQSELLNALFYLHNAYLMDVSPKHLLMLNEKIRFDRNKAIANILNEKIKRLSNYDANLDEIQLGNAFAKTIRHKISCAMNVWDKRVADNLVDITSDQEAVHYAKVLGLLPLPKIVEELIASNVNGLG
jgi:hypothetical protein